MSTIIPIIYISVTKCICTLCLCCTLYATLSVFLHVWTSFDLLVLCMFYVLLILDVTKSRGESAREKVRGNANSLLQIPLKKKKEPLAVAHLLLPNSNLLLPLTVYI